MSIKLRATSGTYNVRASEMARDSRQQPVKTVRCIVYFLDDTEAIFDIDVSVQNFQSKCSLPQVFEFAPVTSKFCGESEIITEMSKPFCK